MRVTMRRFLFKDRRPGLYRPLRWQADTSRTPIEHLVEYLLTGSVAPHAPAETEEIAAQVLYSDLKDLHVVVLGGGTGLSTVVGGNSQMPDWPDHPSAGLKQEFPRLHSIVCTTDDGGSTGLLLKSLPMIGVGDLRKTLLSSILPQNLRRKYELSEQDTRLLIRFIHHLFNYRFPPETSGFEMIRDPLKAVPSKLRYACPAPLAEALRAFGACISPGGPGPIVPPAGHAFGNLILTAAIFKAAHHRADRPPGLREIQSGIDTIAALIGAPPGRIHAATATPGQLKFRYANGVEVYGQSKSSKARRNSPVERIAVDFWREPTVSETLRRVIREADLILYAPGSLYTSTMPILQLAPIVDSIRANRKALKILGANSWIQEGETDISYKNEARGFLVSELIEAYDRNIAGGIAGMFDVVLSANLEHIPGNILRNYALEGKSPIHLDRAQVEAMGVRAVEATLFSPEFKESMRPIHHDARRFALAVRTLLYADRHLQKTKAYALRRPGSGKGPTTKPKAEPPRQTAPARRVPLPCEYLHSVQRCLDGKRFEPETLKDFLLDLAWENRDIDPAHLEFFRGARVIPGGEWDRSTDWDNVLGYYDPEDRHIKLHKDLLSNPSRLREDFLIALGESLLGRYIEKRRWTEHYGARCYEITLRPAGERESFLNDVQMRSYLRLARMIPDAADDRVYRIMINSDGGFLPPGLLFGLVYAWYLSGSGLTMEYEMNLLRRSPKDLIPLHARDRERKEALVSFFRTEVFGHKDPQPLAAKK